MEKLHFQENQRFRQPWLFAILLGSDLLMIYLILSFSVFATEDMDIAAVIILGITLVIMILLSIAFLTTQLITEIRNDGIFFKFKPFQRKYKEIRFDELESVEVKKYKPVMEYGGWGIRVGGKKRGKAYNVSGNIGIYFVFKDGRKFLLGTQKPESVKKVLQRFTETDSLSDQGITEGI
jgi:hypothetical protein